MSAHNGLLLGFMAVLAALAFLYFVFLAWRADGLADVLLARGWAARGWSHGRTMLLLRVIGVAGAVLSAAGVVIAISKIVG